MSDPALFMDSLPFIASKLLRFLRSRRQKCYLSGMSTCGRCIVLIAGISLALGGPPTCLIAANASNRQADVEHTSAGDLRIMPIYHGSVMLEFAGHVIHIDPWSQGDYTGLPPADLLVITHTHADHLASRFTIRASAAGTSFASATRAPMSPATRNVFRK